MNEPYFKYWGKAEKDGPGYHLLPYHCLDVGGVGHVLLSQRNDLRKRFATISGLDETICCQWIALFLGLHDIGKFSESFQNLRPDLLEKLQGKKSGKTYPVRHDSLGNLLWIESLWRSFESATSASVPDFSNVAEYWQELFQYIANAFTGHHGTPPKRTGLNDLQLRLSAFFTTEEVNCASQYLHDLQAVLTREVGIISQLPSPISIYESTSMQNSSWLMAGFAVLCDWIGSNNQWFQFCERVMPLDEYWRNHAIPQAEHAIRKAGIYTASPKATDSPFADLFPDISKPTPLQKHVIECPIDSFPQLFILEDVTGSGKTEAALFLAKRLMTHGLGHGIFMALPTMATSNAMYGRVAKVYRKFFTDDSTPSLVLAHGARHLSDTFMRSIADADSSHAQKPYGTDEDTASAQCASWLADNRKKALLADAGVGTLDQALLAILPSRFQSLRLFGLTGHILIVDEVHAYDPYMNKLLQTLLSFHSALGGSAILLSATLPNHVRQEFISSFNGGMGMFETPQVVSVAYPLATHLSRDSISEVHVEATPQRITSVDVKIIADFEDVERIITTAAGQGKCVCWIRNTVHDAITGFESLREKAASDNFMIFHARFAMGDRLDIETMVTDCFGRKSKEKDRTGKILIATQVVEQSLDLDFDLLISDLAPMDLLIQRAGRLHRQTRDEQGNPLPYGSGSDRREPPCFIIHGPLPEDDADAEWYKTMFPKAATVYPSHGCLWLTARLLKDKGVLRMPDDARELIEAAFSKAAAHIPATLQKRDDEAFAKRSQDRSLAHINMLKLEEGYVATPNQWLDDMRTPTRLGDTETTVRLARWDGRELTPWYSHSDFPWDMSQVNLRSFFVHSEANHTDPMLREAVEKLKDMLPDKGKWSVLVPLSKGDDGVWHGEAQNKKGDAVILTYDPIIGVTIGKEEA